MGLNEAQIAAQPEAAETMNYTRYVLDIGHAGDALDLLAGLLPCVAGYAEIGLRLLHDPATKMEGNPYASGSATTATRAIWPACVPPSSCWKPSATSAAHRAASPSWRRFSPPPPSWNRLLADGAERLMTSPLLPPGIRCGISACVSVSKSSSIG